MTLLKSISGIRGTIGGKVGENLTPVDIVKYTSAYGAFLKESSPKSRCVVIGRDARPTGEMIATLVSATLQSMGFDVIDVGLSTTPTVEIAVPMEKAAGGIIVTASHNPAQWNALKLLNASGEFLSAADGARVLEIADSEGIEFSKAQEQGSHQIRDGYIGKHIDAILHLPLVKKDAIQSRHFKVVVDAVNSTGGIAVPQLLNALGVTFKEVHCTPDGKFPHNPEPLPENLTDLSREVSNGNYDLGIAVDPDVDRLALICEDGSPFGEEYTLVAVADYVLQHSKSKTTVSNLSSTLALREVTENAGGQYFASPVGEVNVVEKMKATGAVIGGEGNGGVIYPAFHYGRDGLLGIALFLSHLATSSLSASRLRATYPNFVISKNKIELSAGLDVDAVLESMKLKYKRQPINTEDGVKISFDREWVHLRKSNTEPIIRIYAESDSETKAIHLANKILDDIRAIMHGEKQRA